MGSSCGLVLVRMSFVGFLVVYSFVHLPRVASAADIAVKSSEKPSNSNSNLLMNEEQEVAPQPKLPVVSDIVFVNSLVVHGLYTLMAQKYRCYL